MHRQRTSEAQTSAARLQTIKHITENKTSLKWQNMNAEETL